MRVDWRVFNQDEPDDNKLMDFIISYGRPFPPYDSDGKEIVPTAPGIPGTTLFTLLINILQDLCILQVYNLL